MASNPFTFFIFDLFIIAAILITAYTCNFYYLVFLSTRRKETYPTGVFEEPTITIQLPIYNEKYVAARLVDAVCAMDYPKEKMKIMVLDDSNDETVELLENLVTHHKKNMSSTSGDPLDEETREKLNNANWDTVLPKILKYAHWRVRMYTGLPSPDPEVHENATGLFINTSDGFSGTGGGGFYMITENSSASIAFDAEL